MNNSQVAHAWANQTKPSAKGSNFYFEGRSIYSYGHHYEVARIIETPKNGSSGLIILNSAGYSVTTTRHKYEVSNAIDKSAYEVIYVPCLDIKNPRIKKSERSHRHNENVSYLVDIFQRAKISAIKCRVDITYKLRVVEHAQDKIDLYLQFFHPELLEKEVQKLEVISTSPMFTQEEQDKIDRKRKTQKLAEEAAEIKREEIERLEREEAKKRLPDWRNGGTVSSGVLHRIPVALRVSGDNKKIETSRGADVPISEARALYKRIKTSTIQEGPHVIAGFPIHGEMGGVLKIGCHNIAMSEVEAIASVLNW